jgi:hypothetical protein
VGFVGEGFVVADRGVVSVAKKWWVLFEIWPWKLGVGNEASSPVREDLAEDEVGLGWIGLGCGGKGLGWGGIKFAGVWANVETVGGHRRWGLGWG